MVGGVAVMRCAMGRQSLAETIFVVAVMLITIGIMLDANMFSTGQGYSDSFPLLINEDAYRSWINANAFYEGNWRTAPLVWNLYGAILAITFIPFGPSIAMALTVSMIAGAVTLLLTTLTAWRLTRSRVVATAALGATAMVAYLMVSATILVKDIWVVMGFAIAAYGLCQWRRTTLWWALGAILAVSFARPNVVLELLVGIIIMALVTPRTQRSRWPFIAAVTVIGLVVMFVAKSMAVTPTIRYQLSNSHPFAENTAEDRVAFFNMLGEDAPHSPLQKIILFPILALVQFIIPLPWDFGGDAEFGLTLYMAHFSYPWYLFGAVVVFYLCAAKRSAGDKRLLALTLWGVFCWLIPVYVALGTVPRYALCAVPLMAPAVGAVLVRCRKRRALWIWLAVFAVLMAIGLTIVYHIQHSVM